MRATKRLLRNRFNLFHLFIIELDLNDPHEFGIFWNHLDDSETACWADFDAEIQGHFVIGGAREEEGAELDWCLVSIMQAQVGLEAFISSPQGELSWNDICVWLPATYLRISYERLPASSLGC